MNSTIQMRILVVASCLLLQHESQGALITILGDRAALGPLLGPGAVTEDFEKYSIPDTEAVNPPVSVLDSSTIYLGQGPGLVQPGLSIAGVFVPGHSLSEIGSVQWNGHGYFNLLTKSIVYNNMASMVIDFNAPVSAFGVDLEAFDGFIDIADVLLYGKDHKTNGA